jgi:hypothetical protein
MPRLRSHSSRRDPGRSARHGRRVNGEYDDHLRGDKPQRTVAFVPDPGDSDRYDPPKADSKEQGFLSVKELWVNTCPRLEDPLPNYGSVDSVNRVVT